MKIKSVFFVGSLLLVFVMFAGCSVLQEPQAASEPMEAIPLELEETEPPPTEVPPTEVPPTEVPATAEPAEDNGSTPTVEAAPEPTEDTPEPMEESPAGEMADTGAGLLIYQIVPGESEVRFEIDEDLRGTRNTVVGVTDQVAGELAVDLNDLSTTQIGALQINARTLATDNEFRNRAIKNEILDTNEFEFITFTPTSVDGLPDSIGVGEPAAFTITGDLTIRDITSEASFEVEATAVSADEINGTASTAIQRSDYDIIIPSVQNVANVEEEVDLTIDFIARAGSGEAAEMPAEDEAAGGTGMLMLADAGGLGPFLTDGAGMTLYTFASDEPGVSNCYDRCAVAWPPLLVEAEETLAADTAIPGELGTTEREDGTVQVTYDGWPLYYWFMDEAPGDTTGHNVGNVWAVAWPETKVLLGGNEELGRFLTDFDGMTLYRFNADEPGLSNCYDQCAVNWPPLLLAEGEALTGGAGVVGQLGTTERDDGTIQVTYGGMPLYYWVDDETLQVTYNGIPLYYWVDDEAPGDTTGHEVNDVWFVVEP